MSPGSGLELVVGLLNQDFGVPDERCSGLPQPARSSDPIAISPAVQFPTRFMIACSNAFYSWPVTGDWRLATSHWPPATTYSLVEPGRGRAIQSEAVSGFFGSGLAQPLTNSPPTNSR